MSSAIKKYSLPLTVVLLFMLSLFNTEDMNRTNGEKPVSKFAALQFHELIYGEAEPENYLGKRVLFDTTVIGYSEICNTKYLNAVINNKNGEKGYLRIRCSEKLEKYINNVRTNHICFIIEVMRFDKIGLFAEYEEFDKSIGFLNLGEVYLYHGEPLYYREAEIITGAKS
ncbi:hypothetical protein ACSSWA_07045 [Melioribacter sp. Ez-97]|uniref:hypothetical protein n=1 Tax=Melioribacter sp. Ez-97 TaxID=3423434 RepID=UPI003ED994BC